MSIDESGSMKSGPRAGLFQISLADLLVILGLIVEVNIIVSQSDPRRFHGLIPFALATGIVLFGAAIGVFAAMRFNLERWGKTIALFLCGIGVPIVLLICAAILLPHPRRSPAFTSQLMTRYTLGFLSVAQN